jgi:hypothetical protein
MTLNTIGKIGNMTINQQLLWYIENAEAVSRSNMQLKVWGRLRELY